MYVKVFSEARGLNFGQCLTFFNNLKLIFWYALLTKGLIFTYLKCSNIIENSVHSDQTAPLGKLGGNS